MITIALNNGNTRQTKNEQRRRNRLHP